MNKTEAIYKLVENFILITLSKSCDEKIQKVKIHPSQKGFFIEEFSKTQSFHKNLSKEQLIDYLQTNIGNIYKNTTAITDSQIISFLTNKKGKTTVIQKQTSSKDSQHQNNLSKNQNIIEHNRKKNYILSENSPIDFLIELGVMNNEGKIISKYYDKFRQINRFLEFIADILPNITNVIGNANQNQKKTLQIIDFGCGKSYLTFAIYYYLTKIIKINCQIIGIDLKADVIDHCKKLAKKCNYSGLEFFCTDVADWSIKNKNSSEPDLVISLHACNTATDYALDFAIKTGAKAILSVPCCQHELNQTLSKAEHQKNVNPQIQPLLKYGIIRERFAALATDVLRAELLESYGYKVQILEFIDMEHTPKNMLIRAVKKTSSNKNNKITKDDNKTSLTLTTNFLELKKGLDFCPTLEKLLNQ